MAHHGSHMAKHGSHMAPHGSHTNHTGIKRWSVDASWRAITYSSNRGNIHFSLSSLPHARRAPDCHDPVHHTLTGSRALAVLMNS
jgi:hypothetical protein